MGNFKSLGGISERGNESVQAFWEYAAFVANSLVFLLIGMHEAHQNFVAIWVPAGIAIALVTLGRAGAIYPCCLLFRVPRFASLGNINIFCSGAACEGQWRRLSPWDFLPKFHCGKRSLQSVLLSSLFRYLYKA
jgi:NhaP-type Na+/H+ or K+/H+ antiporter